MGKEGRNYNYTWLLHIAIWAVLFGMPFFSPRPGHPLHGGVEYSRFIPVLASFLVVFYANYLVLIGQYMYTRKFGRFILWNVLLVATVSILVHLTFRYAYPAPPVMPLPRHPETTLDNLSFITRNSMIYLAIICVAIAVKMTGRWYEDERKRREMEKSQAEAELAALKSQVNPHFLFNTLNNIYSLIRIDQDKAQEAVHNLGGMLRYVLYESEGQKVPLAREVAFLRDYVKLMGMRLASDVKLDVSLPETTTGRQVAPMLFIPLVENAFKHGVGDTGSSFIKIDLREEGDYISFLVENSCFPKDDSDHSGSGIGVKNLCRRLDMLYPGKYSFEYGRVHNVYRSLLRIDTETPGNPPT